MRGNIKALSQWQCLFRALSRCLFPVFLLCAVWGLLWKVLLRSFHLYWVALNYVASITQEIE